MTCSEARLAANRANALKSTGPRTPEGKDRSRANSLKHGLCATICVPEDTPTIQGRIFELFGPLKPQNEFHTWLVERIAVGTLRIDRCERMERRARDKVALRAELTWDDDRKLDAEILGGQLARKPAQTVEALKRTPHGCDWLIGRWALLANVADAQETWTADQISLAFDLQAVPSTFRDARQPGTSIDSEGRQVGVTTDLAGLARREIAALKDHRGVVAGLDEVERALTAADLNLDSDPEIRRIRRYETTLHTRLRWSVGQISAESKHRFAFPGLEPAFFNQPEPEAPTVEEKLAEHHPENSPHPPFDLEPDEFPPSGQKADIPKIIRTRKEKQIAKAEDRRQAKRRKLDKLRA
jgi:hypothetical protein